MKQIFEQLWIIALTDFKLRYSNSVLGYVWSLLKPLLMFAVLYVVFSVFMRIQVEHYQLHLLLGIILWNFFAEGTSYGMYSLFTKANLITKLAFPRWRLVVASTFTSFMTLCLNLVIFFGFLLINGVYPDYHALLFPVYVLELYIMVLSISLGLSVLVVRFRDVGQIWDVVLQAGFFMSPIAYSLDIVPAKYHPYLFLNPITSVVQYSRSVLIMGQWPTLIGTLVAFATLLVIVFFGYMTFRSLQRRVAEHL